MAVNRTVGLSFTYDISLLMYDLSLFMSDLSLFMSDISNPRTNIWYQLLTLQRMTKKTMVKR